MVIELPAAQVCDSLSFSRTVLVFFGESCFSKIAFFMQQLQPLG